MFTLICLKKNELSVILINSPSFYSKPVLTFMEHKQIYFGKILVTKILQNIFFYVL